VNRVNIGATAAPLANEVSGGHVSSADLEVLRQAERRWRQALEVAGHGVWDWDMATGALHLSPGFARIIGVAADTPFEQVRWLDSVHDDDRQAVRDVVVAHLRGQTPEIAHECRVVRPDGVHGWVMIRAQVVQRDGDGRALRMLGTLSNTTQRRQAEQLQRDKQAAEVVARSKARFLSRMSHEMRTPLNAVIGFAGLMTDPQVNTDPTRVHEYAEHVQSAGRQLLELVDDVLDLQRAEEGRLGLQVSDVSLRSLVPVVFGRCRELALNRSILLVDAIAGNPVVRADATRLLQVLVSLVTNGIKFNRPTGTVRVGAEPAGEQRWAVTVEDSGSGLSEAQVQMLFQPFERLGSETSSTEGSGLELMVAQALVKSMGGSLTLSSRPGAGTRAVVELPRAQPGKAVTADPATAPASRPSTGMRVLYVEDNRVNALLFCEALRALAQVDVCVAEDGAEALDLASTWRPDVLVLDAHLPDIDGHALLARLRTLPGLGTVPAFMCSADALPQDIERARASGFVGYWVKPIDFTRVLADLKLASPASAA
jgi:PAS domain S-box-containing protein